jgi:hypothetical protein
MRFSIYDRPSANQRPLLCLAVGLMTGEDEDRHAVVVVAALAIGELKCPPAGDHRPGGHHLVVYLAVHTRRTAWDS